MIDLKNVITIEIDNNKFDLRNEQEKKEVMKRLKKLEDKDNIDLSIMYLFKEKNDEQEDSYC